MHKLIHHLVDRRDVSDLLVAYLLSLGGADKDAANQLLVR
jgi:hypothetical protein